MRIAFILPSVEPGRNGVGDYTRALAQECTKAGHPCTIVGIHDLAELDGDETVGPADEVSVLRLSQKRPWQERVTRARSHLAEFRPDFLSLQFVPFGFHPKGLAWEIVERLASMAGEYPVHIMFHEIWVGAHRGAPWKQRVLGTLQRIGITRLVRRLRPAVVHTSNGTYAALLRQSCIKAKVLRLFGNIPIGPEDDGFWKELTRDTPVAAKRDSTFLTGFFGALHPEWTPEPLFGSLAEAAQRCGRTVTVVGLGRMGPGERKWEDLAKTYGTPFRFVRFGERSPAFISTALEALDFGLATTPLSILGKSGTVAALLERGVPVIVSRDDIHYRLRTKVEVEEDPLVVPLRGDLADRVCRGLPRRAAASWCGETARAFISDLQEVALSSTAMSGSPQPILHHVSHGS